MPTPAWSPIATAPARRWRRIPPLGGLLAVLVALAGPLLAPEVIEATSRRPFVLGTLGVCALLVTLMSGRPWEPLLFAASAGAVGSVTGPRAAGILVAVDTLAALTALSGAPPSLGRSPARPTSRALSGAGLVISHVILWRTSSMAVPTLVASLAVLLAGVFDRVHLSGVDRFTGAVERGAGAVGGALANLTTLVLASPLIIFIRFGQWVTRVDPLAVPTDPGSGWVRRSGPDHRPGHSYALIPTLPRRIRFRRLQSTLAALLSVILAGGVAVGVLALFRVPLPFVFEEGRAAVTAAPRAAREEAWYRDLNDDLGQVKLEWSQAGLFISPDVSTRYVNVLDGRRKTWRPPSCSCRRLRVWVFGGSAAFGYWQRDEHTIASELARAAWADGLALDVTNFAMPAYTLWQEFDRLGYLLASEPEPPDLVVFYDGANEIGIQQNRNEDGFGADDSPGSALDGPMRILFPRAKKALGWQTSLLDLLTESNENTRGNTPLLPPDQVARHAVDRYLQALKAADFLTRGAGIPAAFVWQPLYLSGSERLGDPAVFDEAGKAEWTALVRGTARLLPDEVMDLSGVFHEDDGVVFYDHMHNNERGARIIGGELYRRLESRLRMAASTAGG